MQCGDSKVCQYTQAEKDGTFTFDISSPNLWWPNGLGAPDLYDCTIRLKSENGTELDTRALKVGLRTVALDTSVRETRKVDYKLGSREDDSMDGGFIPSWTRVPLDEPEEVEIENFKLIINGQYVFVRGSNWQTLIFSLVASLQSTTVIKYKKPRTVISTYSDSGAVASLKMQYSMKLVRN